MPNKVIKSKAKQHNTKPAKVEKVWNKGKKEATKKGLTGERKYKYAMGAVENGYPSKKKKS